MSFGFALSFPRTRPASGAWTPANLGASLALWLDADDASTITLNGSNVSQWDDKSGNDRHATQAIAANQPTYTASGLNGKPVITFPGGGDGFVLASGVPVPRDMVSVSQGNGYLYSANTTTERIVYSSSSLWWGTASGSPVGASVPSRNTTSTYIEQYSSDGSDYEVLLNGESALSGSLSSLWTNDNLMTQIGLQWAATTGISSWAGTIAEIVWTNSVMSTEDRQKLEGYLAWKWGGV